MRAKTAGVFEAQPQPWLVEQHPEYVFGMSAGDQQLISNAVSSNKTEMGWAERTRFCVTDLSANPDRTQLKTPLHISLRLPQDPSDWQIAVGTFIIGEPKTLNGEPTK